MLFITPYLNIDKNLILKLIMLHKSLEIKNYIDLNLPLNCRNDILTTFEF